MNRPPLIRHAFASARQRPAPVAGRRRWRLAGSLFGPPRANARRLRLELLEHRDLLAGVPFSDPQVLTAATTRRADSIEVADLDGDGDQDVVYAAERTGRIAWYANGDGRGQFALQQVVTENAGATLALEVVDLDGDQDFDLLTGAYEGDTVAWYENVDGRGTFGPRRVVPTDAFGVTDVSSADVDADGDPDLLIAAIGSSTVTWHENRGGRGDFGPPLVIDAAAPDPLFADAADFDGDGSPEVYIATETRERWFYHRTDNQWNPSRDGIEWSENRTYDENAQAIDLDADGDLDLLLPDGSSWLNNSQGFFGSYLSPWLPPFGNPPPLGGQAIRSEDLDGDGKADRVGVSSADGNVVVFYADGQWRLLTDQALGVMEVETADLDGDGRVDVLSASPGDHKLAWYRNLGQGNFGPQQFIAEPGLAGANFVQPADLDADGDLDVLAASALTWQTIWFENEDGQGHSGPAQILQTDVDQFQVLATGDFDGDGKLDVVATRSNAEVGTAAHSLVLLRHTDVVGIFDSRSVVPYGLARSVLPHDFDGDGDLDLLAAIFEEGDNALIWLENQNGFQQPDLRHLITNDQFGEASSYDLADVDRDGDLDVVAALVRIDPDTGTDSRLVWYENRDGRGQFAAGHLITADPSGARSVRAADMDGDGDADLVLAVIYESGVIWYENLDGRGTFHELARVVSDQVDLVRVVRPSDLDADGDLDLVIASRGDDTVGWYENLDGRGSFGTRQLISDRLDDVRDVAVADLDGDGDVDLLSASANDAQVAWYRNDTPAPTVPGDLTNDGRVDEADIDRLSRAIRSASDAPRFDLNGDAQRNGHDLDHLIESILRTSIGDANLDGIFNSSDFIQAFQAGEYEDGIAVNSTWAEGDWDGDGEFSSADFVAAFQHGGYATAAEPAFLTDQIISEVEVHRPVAADAADLDGDGDLDAIAVSRHDGEITWYENLDGHGTFSRRRIVQTVAGADRQLLSARLGDLDGDGITDVAWLAAGTAATDVPQFRWQRNDGHGTFAAPTAGISLDAIRFALHDLDLDGDLDVLGSSAEWLENLGQGQLAAHSAPPLTHFRAATVADFDGDGDLDLLAAESGRVSWLENQGAMQWIERQSFTSPQPVVSVAAADVDGDGDTDWLWMTATDESGAIVWCENTRGFAELGAPQRLSDAGGRGVLGVADVEGDGDLDIVAASSLASGVADQVFWLQNEGKGHFASAAIVSENVLQPRDLVVADLNSDGRNDLLVAGFGSHQIVWLEWTGASIASWWRHAVTDPGAPPTQLLAGDIDGDGATDVVTASDVRGEVVWHRWSSASGQFSKPIIVSDQVGQISWMSLADIERDGDLDIVLASTSRGTVVWWENQAGAFSAQHLLARGLVGMTDCVLADLDGDDDLDLAVAPTTNLPLQWHRNDGHGVFELAWQRPMDGIDAVLAAADMDQDGDQDLIIGYSYYLANRPPRGKVVLLTNPDGSGQFSEAVETVVVGARLPISIHPADLNGDGTPETVVLAGVFSTSNRIYGVSYPYSDGFYYPVGLADLHVIDVDRDGDLDLVTRAETSLWMLPNVGSGMVDEWRELLPIRAQLFVAADLDRDGTDDFITADTLFDTGRIVWHANRLDSSGVAGDVNRDGVRDVQDLDALCLHRGESALNNRLLIYDSDSDGSIDADDLVYFQLGLSLGAGDANGDGRFDSEDFVQVFQRGEYEDDQPANSVWTDGDWDFDGEFTSADLIAAFAEGRYESIA